MNKFIIGNHLSITVKGREKLFKIISFNDGDVRLEDSVTGAFTSERIQEISAVLSKGEGKIISDKQEARDLNSSDSLDFSGYEESDKNEAKYRLKYINVVFSENEKNSSRVSLEKIIKTVSHDENIRAPSIRSLQRWIKSFIESDYSVRGLLPCSRNRGNKTSKVAPQVEPFISQGILHYRTIERCSVMRAYDKMKSLIHYENEIGLGEKLVVPSYRSFLSRVEKESPYELAVARTGKKAAKKEFKVKRQPPKISTILERAEIDHTKLDLFVVDDRNALPLGRPWITAVLDYYSRSIMGFYISFVPPSYLSISKALKHALSSKDYIKEVYPDIENTWPVFGVMSTLVSDRGKDFESEALKEACLDLNITLQFNPVKCPWYKGVVERYFGTLNRELLDDKPGKTFSSIINKGDYDPEKNAVISFSRFIEIMHMWVVDVYQQSPRSNETLVPNCWWEEALVNTPVFSVDSETLNIVLGKFALPSLSKDGIRLDYIYYDSDELLTYRMQIGYGKVKIKIDPDDLGEIHVFNKLEQRYFTVPAVDQDYAMGLSSWQHQVIKNYVKNKVRTYVDEEALSRAKRKISQLVEEEILNTKSLARSRARLARYLKIGQQLHSEPEVENTKTIVKYEDVVKSASQHHLSKPSGDNEIPIIDLGEVEDDWPDELDT
ncbi:MAG: Mu transposase C-terminal domain-containing protein [Colwellia sp.]|nr:Mu transposase C-terminal domain-containing protein [Colwellia sp.]